MDSKEEQIFEQNLEVFERFCPGLADKVRNADCQNYELFQSKSDDLNIKKKGVKEDFYFHSPEDPKKEAEMWFNSLDESEKADLLVVYGVGFGYYYNAAKKWLEKDPKRLIIFVENDFSLLNFFFRTEQGETVLKDPQAAVLAFQSEGFDEKGKKLGSLAIIALLLPECSTQFSALKAYETTYAPLFSKLKRVLQFHAKETGFLSFFFQPTTIQQDMQNIFSNLWELPESKNFYAMKGCLAGSPAIICGAGPSLVDDLPRLKSCLDRALVFGAGTGMNILNKNGIIPPLGVAMDPNETTRERILTSYAFETPYCFKLGLNHAALTLMHGEKIYFRGCESYGVASLLETELLLNSFPLIHSSLTTTHACLGIAAFLGCSPIILLGVDLSYTDRKRYPDDYKVHPLDQTREHTSPLDAHEEVIILSKATGGGLVETRADWIREASRYNKFSKKHPEANLMNATSRGLEIPGVPYLPFEEAVQKERLASLDFENLIHTEIQNSPLTAVTNKQIEDVLTDWQKGLEEVFEKILEIMEEFSRILQAAKENPDLPQEYPTGELAKLKEEFRSTPLYRHVLYEQEGMFHKFFFQMKYPILYRPEVYQGNQKTIAEIHYDSGLYMFLQFFIQILKQEGEASLKNGREMLKRVDGKKTLSKQAPHSESGIYTFKANRIIIQDEELDLHWEEAFSPKMIPQGETGIARGAFHDASQKNGLPDGQCLLYYPSGTIKGECFYKEGKLHGPSSFHSEKGELLARGWFIDGKREGKNVQYYPSGKLYSLKRYKGGKSHGLQEYFYQSGIQKTLMDFVEGEFHGCVRLYYPDGGLKRETHFKEGKLHGFERMWDNLGQLIMESEYAANLPVGFSRSWHPNGQRKEEKKFYGSPEHFDYTSWDDSGNVLEKKIYLPTDVGRDFMDASQTIKEGLQRIKEKLEKGKLEKGKQQL